MSTMEITAYACSFCDAVASFFKKSLRKIQFGMQMSANQKVARELCSLGFHQQKEFNQILQKMNDATIDEYHSKY
jgi:hypothetical protein